MLLNLSKEESQNLLNLRKETVNLLCLSKNIAPEQKARVSVVMDYSGSMSNLYKNGTVQAVLERLLPIAMQFDDNGEMELWLFDDSFRRLPNITLKNFYGYVDKEIMSKNWHMGCTEYAPIMKDVFKKYMVEEPDDIPNLVLFITDGNNSDAPETRRTITKLAEYPIFWQFVGIGGNRFTFLEALDELDGRYVDNANFFPLNDFAQIEDNDLYGRLLEEYPNWLNYPELKQMSYKSDKTLDEIMNPSSGKHPEKKKGFFSKLFG